MVEATISRVRMRDLARPGRMRFATGERHRGVQHRHRSPVAPGAASSRPGVGDLVASTIHRPPRTRYFPAMRLADSISLRSRERKLRLFLEELRPRPTTTVLDVGADELGFGEGDGCGTLNFFEERYPWPERITALGLHDGAGFRSRYPDIPYVQGDACASPLRTAIRHRLLERGHRARRRPRAAARVRVGGDPGRPPCLHHDAEPPVSGRGAHAAPARPLAAGRDLASRVQGDPQEDRVRGRAP